MFDQLYVKPAYLARHLNAPYAEERARYLSHSANQGYTKATILLKARELLWVARKLNAYGSLRVTTKEIEAVAQDWAEREKKCGQKLRGPWTRIRFLQVAKPWIRFLGFFDAAAAPPPFADRIEAYTSWMVRERGLAASTVKRSRETITQFLRWYGHRQQAFETVRLEDIDAYLAEGYASGWGRRYVRNITAILRRFYRFAGMKGWCAAVLGNAIRGPRAYAHDSLPLGPSWPDVQRLLATIDTDKPADIRDRAILMLFAVYGLRAGEVAGLTLDEFDWDQDLLYVCRAKGLGRQVCCAPTSSSSTNGERPSWRMKNEETSSRSLKTVTTAAPPLSPPRYPSNTGTKPSATPPWPTPFLTD